MYGILFLPLEGLFLCAEFLTWRGRYANRITINGGAEMKGIRSRITLACSECKQRNYDTVKNKKNDPDRLEMNKYCRFCRKHTLHKETK
jgi:large subunit ribosomal protein L33